LANIFSSDSQLFFVGRAIVTVVAPMWRSQHLLPPI
jgi:hypothetical protein